jgi:hypothetical protein
MVGRPSITADYISVILRAIEKAENDPVHLRSLIYDLSRLSLGKHLLNNYRLLGSEGLQRHLHDLETAINQIEDMSQKQLADPSKVPRLEPAVRSSSQAVITVRDSFGDAIFDDGWLDNAPVALRQGSDGVVHDTRGVTKILQPSEIWQPGFARDPKSNRARPDFWWGVQLASAALIGVCIYAVMLVRSNLFFPGLNSYSQAAQVSQGVAVASIAPNAAGPGVPSAVHPSAGRSLGFPLPSVYGVYAVSEGKLYELDQLAMRVPDPRVRISAMISEPSRVTVPEGKLNFVIYRRDLAASAPVEVFVRVVAQVRRQMTFSGAGPPTTTDIRGQWAVRSKSYTYRVAPVEDSPETIVLRPGDPELNLSPGRYVLVLAGQGYDFTVAGKVTDVAQCLERSSVVGGEVYSECRTVP